jgi:Na+/H+ antiporter NhaD/arsenite permease-like protein
MIPIIFLLVVFVLIAVRQVGNVRFHIWQIMLLGAIGVLVTGQISPLEALKSINPDVMLFLFGVFIVGQALEDSGYLSHLSYRYFRRARSLHSLTLGILFGMGLLSAFLMNDTLAIIGTTTVLSLSKKTGTHHKVLLLALAFAVTIGSAMSPIGNPQNLLIATNGDIANPFVTFFSYLLLPTLINLLIAYFMLWLYYRKHFRTKLSIVNAEPITDPRLAVISRISLALLAGCVLLKIIFVFAGVNIDFRLTYIALIAAMPVLLFSRKRLSIVKSIDWATLVFFAAMFVLMKSVWNTGFFQSLLASARLDLSSHGVILGVSVLLSQLISNVPLVALYLPVLAETGAAVKEMILLAAGSTIAGNLTILGAASNVIIIQNAEKRAGLTLTFWEFVRIGLPLTVMNLVVYWLFIVMV